MSLTKLVNVNMQVHRIQENSDPLASGSVVLTIGTDGCHHPRLPDVRHVDRVIVQCKLPLSLKIDGYMGVINIFFVCICLLLNSTCAVLPLRQVHRSKTVEK